MITAGRDKSVDKMNACGELELISRFEAQLSKRRNATARVHCGAAIRDGKINALSVWRIAKRDHFYISVAAILRFGRSPRSISSEMRRLFIRSSFRHQDP
jgi:hypothetical protein